MNGNNVTFCVKTFQRPESLRACLQSIRRFAPNSPILVCDDGLTDARKQTDLSGLHDRYFRTRFDIGVAAGRNLLVQRARTPLVFIIDDDETLTNDSHLDAAVDRMQSANCDLLAFTIDRPKGWLLVQDGNTLRLRPGYHERRHGCFITDCVQLCMLADRRALLTSLWDPRFKVDPHWEIFLRAKRAGLTVASTDHHRVGHDKKRPGNYGRFRQRLHQFERIARRKHDLQHVHMTWNAGIEKERA